jgi:hypothetical protein
MPAYLAYAQWRFSCNRDTINTGMTFAYKFHGSKGFYNCSACLHSAGCKVGRQQMVIAASQIKV